MMPSVLLVDSDREMLEEMRQACLSDRWHTVAVNSGRAALDVTARHSVKVALVSMELVDTDGVYLIAKLRNLYPGINFIVVTSDYREETEREARKAEILTYLTKPLDHRLLRRVVQRAVEEREEK